MVAARQSQARLARPRADVSILLKEIANTTIFLVCDSLLWEGARQDGSCALNVRRALSNCSGPFLFGGLG